LLLPQLFLLVLLLLQRLQKLVSLSHSVQVTLDVGLRLSNILVFNPRLVCFLVHLLLAFELSIHVPSLCLRCSLILLHLFIDFQSQFALMTSSDLAFLLGMRLLLTSFRRIGYMLHLSLTFRIAQATLTEALIILQAPISCLNNSMMYVFDMSVSL